MRGGYKSQRIFCQAKTRFGVACKAKGYFIPNLRQFRCIWHGAIHSYTYEKRIYRGLFKKTNVSIEGKVKQLKNLINFKNKTDDEIKIYIRKQEALASGNKRYRSKFYTRNYLRWRNTSYRNKRHLKDQLDEFLSVFRTKSKV